MTIILPNWIAERALIAEDLESQKRVDILIKISAPSWREDLDYFCCQFCIEGLSEKIIPVLASDQISAIEFALEFDKFLDKFRSKYNFYWPDGSLYQKRIDHN